MQYMKLDGLCIIHDTCCCSVFYINNSYSLSNFHAWLCLYEPDMLKSSETSENNVAQLNIVNVMIIIT